MKFLTAHWKNLVVVNYECDPDLLTPYIPNGTELDAFEGKHYVSLVAFQFHRNRLFGAVPSLPSNFEEVNLRFYIRRGENRAVAFIKEVVPSKLIAKTAKRFYNEPYEAMPMAWHLEATRLTYSWGRELEHSITATTAGEFQELQAGTLEEYILEHYYGYTPQRDGSTIEYRVQHPKWMHKPAANVQVSPEVASFYGETFAPVLSAKTHSAYVAAGSPVSVSMPRRLKLQSAK